MEGCGPLFGNLFICVEVSRVVFLGLYDSNAHIPYFETCVERPRYLPSEIHARQDQVLRNGVCEHSLFLHGFEAAKNQWQQVDLCFVPLMVVERYVAPNSTGRNGINVRGCTDVPLYSFGRIQSGVAVIERRNTYP